jgi:hypothetical protein
MEKFTMADIHSGYVISLRSGRELLCMRVDQNNFTKIFLCESNEWFYASAWDDETLKWKGQNGHPRDFDIVRVYGLISISNNYMNANTTDFDGRRLLWQRVEPKTIKMSQIRRLLGVNATDEIIIEVDDNA